MKEADLVGVSHGYGIFTEHQMLTFKTAMIVHNKRML